MAIATDILAFAENRPMWERDLLRRIYTQPDLTEDDFAEVLRLVKIAGSLDAGDNVAPRPLLEEHVLHRPADAPPVIIASIGDVKNAMQLAEGQMISFAADGVTVIYGENGSGKSGYCKLLKQLCRSRREPENTTVLENVYTTETKALPTVTVRFKVGEEEVTSLAWTAGQPSPSDLSRISVFDSRMAPLYADKEDKIEFLPAGLDVLPRLVKACEEISRRLEAEIAPLRAAVLPPLPQMLEGTEQATAVALLNDKTALAKLPTTEVLEALARWEEADTTSLAYFVSEMAADPAARAKVSRQIAAILGTHLESIARAGAVLSDAALTRLGTEIASYCAARDIAQQAATEQFAEEPIKSVIGTPSWQKMFFYAADVYSKAFPEHDFPSPDETAICPLCQQALDTQAYSRIQRFQALIAGAAQKDASERAEVLKARIADLESVALPTTVAIQTGLAAFAAPGSIESEAVASLISWVEAGISRKVAALAAVQRAEEIPTLAALSEGLVEPLVAWKARLEEDAVADEAAAQDPGRTEKLAAELKVLKGRKVLHENRATVLTRRNQLVQIKKLAGCLIPRHTAPISGKNTELCQRYLTEGFGRKLTEEMNNLNIGYLPVTVRGHTDKGVSYVGPDLTKAIQAKTSNILSEGEFRALSLACFFAEVSTIDGHNGIVLDDPVSSLDHHHIREVAARILAEAKTRQVVVFTHELSFYYELWHQATEAAVPLIRHWVMRSDEYGFGTVKTGDAPWLAKSVKERLKALEESVASIKAADIKHGEQYERSLTDYYTKLRETWERLVEEKLLNSVVGRFQPGVMTQSLAGVEVSAADYQTVYFAMKRVSEYSGHDWSRGRLPHVPTIGEVEKGLVDIREYLASLNKRITALQSERKKTVEAPPGGALV